MILGEEFIVFIYRGNKKKNLEQGCSLLMAADLTDHLLIFSPMEEKKKSKHCNKSQRRALQTENGINATTQCNIYKYLHTQQWSN